MDPSSHSRNLNEVTTQKENIEDVSPDISIDAPHITGGVNPTEHSDNIVVLRDRQTSRRLIDRKAYAKLQRSLSPTKINNNIDTLKEKYEKCEDQVEDESHIETSQHKLKRSSAIKLDNETVQVLRNKSKLPIARPRTAVKSELLIPTKLKDNKYKFRHSVNLDRKSKKRDENANELFRKNSSSSGEFISVVTRSESEGSIDKFAKELNMFTMEKKPKEKKRSNSFRRIFSGKIFGKEKKKPDENSKQQYRENAAYNDNVQNESNSFSRESPHRHTTGNTSNIPKPRISRIDSERPIRQTNYDIKDIEKQYAQMHVKEFNHIKQNFDPQHCDKEEKLINNPGPIDYKKMPTMKKFIDTSSSTSTLESQRDSGHKQTNGDNDTLNKFNRFGDSQREFNRDTPPRAQELRQDVRLVNPKALIPINSERPLPNPYQNMPIERDSYNSNSSPKHNQFNFVDDSKIVRPYLEETYGTVLDSLEQKNALALRQSTARLEQKPPRSPHFDSPKLKLPPNRDITPLSPRMKSPIPQHHISTEKIIATELLKSSRSPTPTRKKTGQLSPSHQRLEIGIDYPDDINGDRIDTAFEARSSVTTRPPIPRVSDRIHGQNQSSSMENTMSQAMPPTSRVSSYGQTLFNFQKRTSQASPIQGQTDKVLTNAMVHTRTPTPNTILQNQSLSPMTRSTTNLSPMQSQSTRSNTPIDIRASPSTNKSQSPQKEDIKRSVEAYYWKEIKKLKDQENQELYYYQTQMMPFGYAEDPVRIRRARSSSPSAKNSRRSLSLPRDPKSPPQVNPNQNYSMFKSPPIPEERAVMHQLDGAYYQPNFRRNTPERRTVGGVTNGNTYSNTIYRPIFKRGSLTTPVRELIDDQQKKVSFNNSKDPRNNHSWPTKNGYTQSPPQRRIEVNRNNSLEDDVFLPDGTQTSRLVMNGKEIYGYANRPFDNLQNQYVPRQQLSQYPQHPSMRYPQGSQERIATSRQMISPQEDLYYRQTVEYPRANQMVRHGSIQFEDPVYVQRLPRRMSLDNRGYQGQVPVPNPNYPPPRRQIFLNDDIYGSFGGYQPQNPNEPHNMMYGSRQSIVESAYGYNQSTPRHISMNDKVCDIYGQIHDKDNPKQFKRTGVILGQLQTSPQVARHPPPLQPHENFVRNSRLTASANDMHRRYQNMDPRYNSDVVYRQYVEKAQDGAPSRPLPPVPNNNKVVTRQSIESVSSDNQRNRNVGKNKKRGIFGGPRPSNNNYCELSKIQEETNDLDTLELERLVLSEKLKLLRMENISEGAPMMENTDEFHKDEQFSNAPEIRELRRLVFLEELQLVRMKIKRLF